MRSVLRCIPVVALLCCVAARADSLNPLNDRQPAIPVSGTPAVGDSLQSILDQIYGAGAVNAVTDQETAGMWRMSSYRFPVTVPVMQFRNGPSGPGSSSDSFGIWSADGNTINTVTIFDSNAVEGDMAMLNWNTAGKLLVNGAVQSAFINPSAFGFFIQTTSGQNLYTVDALNPDQAAHALTYLHNGQDGSGEWVLAFNDALNGGSSDFNNVVVSIESITALPEPSSIALFGTSALVIGGLLRRRLAHKSSV